MFNIHMLNNYTELGAGTLIQRRISLKWQGRTEWGPSLNGLLGLTKEELTDSGF